MLLVNMTAGFNAWFRRVRLAAPHEDQPMPRLSFKPDASFFRKIVVGAVGARAVVDDLNADGHDFRELERGSTETKLWKDVKRKRIRIPDLVCIRCGQRVECRAKTKIELAMSHGPTSVERAWDFGMVDSDWIAFPVCTAAAETDWSIGTFRAGTSYWRQKEWVRWQSTGTINYFTVQVFRSRLHARTRTKGVEEASESMIAWDATFSPRHGIVEAVDASTGKVTVRRIADGHRFTWNVGPNKRIAVKLNDEVSLHQVLAAAVSPVHRSRLSCPGQLPPGSIDNLLRSRERTQRFTGVKLARLLAIRERRESIHSLYSDPEEDVYVRLEAASYLNAICGSPAGDLFAPYLSGGDDQNQLEAVIALGEAATNDAVEILCAVLNDDSSPYFLRSAAAWSLSRTQSDQANQRLTQCFADIDRKLREEAIENLMTIGGGAIPALLYGLRDTNDAISAGCAEVLRRAEQVPTVAIDDLIAELNSASPRSWAVWLVGHLPREQFATAIAELQHRKPELHYAIALLWAFVESWIGQHWELVPRPALARSTMEER